VEIDLRLAIYLGLTIMNGVIAWLITLFTIKTKMAVLQSEFEAVKHEAEKQESDLKELVSSVNNMNTNIVDTLARLEERIKFLQEKERGS